METNPLTPDLLSLIQRAVTALETIAMALDRMTDEDDGITIQGFVSVEATVEGPGRKCDAISVAIFEGDA